MSASARSTTSTSKPPWSPGGRRPGADDRTEPAVRTLPTRTTSCVRSCGHHRPAGPPQPDRGEAGPRRARLSARRRRPRTVRPVTTPLGDFLRSRRDGGYPPRVGRPARRGPPPGPGAAALRAGDAGRGSASTTWSASSRDAAARRRWSSTPSPRRCGSTSPSESTCATWPRSAPPPARGRWPPARRRPAGGAGALAQLEPGVALVTNRLGDVLAHPPGSTCWPVPPAARRPGPNLTRFVFADEQARATLPDWDRIAYERAFDLWLGPSLERPGVPGRARWSPDPS